MRRRLAVGALTVLAAVVVPAVPAGAHPLGNFTVNHYDGLRIESRRIQDTAVVDTAEIPTSQLASSIDRDGNSSISSAERAAYATRRCAALAHGLELVVGTVNAQLGVKTASFSFRSGVAGLRTGRLTCQLETMTDVNVGRSVSFVDGFEGDRVGWHEITAVANGVRLDHAPVPPKSITDELRRYPNDLLSSPLDVRRVTLAVLPGAGASTVTPGAAFTPRAGTAAHVLNRVNGAFNNLVGRRRLTLGVGLLAVVLAFLLGASHALLPGHGKTVMAAYIAGRQGSLRDAFVVGATVTATHTAGVLVLGLALTLSASLAGDSVLQWLGVASGLMIAGLGVGLLISSLRGRHGDHHHHDVRSGTGHSHAHPHDHSHGHGGRDHQPVLSRKGLIGMGVAGGLVPSPSALVVLLAAIGLGRTIFGVLLVVSYGVGMAGTLTAAGLVLVKIRDRYQHRTSRRAEGARGLADRWVRLLPLTTSGIVIVVGLGLAGRSLAVF